MIVEFQESRAKFEKLVLSQLIPESVEQNLQDDIDEMVWEIEEELLDAISSDINSKMTTKSKDFCLPADDEVMSCDLNGEVLSTFGQSSWYLIGKSGIKRGFHFTAKRGDDDAYRTDPLATPLVLLEKLLLYAIWPGKDLTQRPYTGASLDVNHKSIRTVLSWLYEQGYFLKSSTDIVPRDNELITAEVVRSELVRRTSEDSLLFHLKSFLTGVRQWVRFGVKNQCPEWFRPTFAFKDIIDKHLAKDIAMCIAKKTNRWEAIDFDSLKPLFSTAQNYLELYAKDIFWLLGKFDLAYDIRVAKSTSSIVLSDITSSGWTSKIYKEIWQKTFTTDPQSGQPWFVPQTYSINKRFDRQGTFRETKKIALSPVLDQLRCLVGAATYVLFSFTGMRHWEMKAMKTGALLIDGKELDETGDIFAQIEAGTSFDLNRTVFKFKPSPSGEQHLTPIPKISAIAYAILVKAFSYSRLYRNSEVEGQNTKFLFPAKGLKFKWQSGGPGLNSDNPHMTTVHHFLNKFCEAADIDYFFPHQCRKTLATLLINNDPECLEIIRWLFGHDSIMVTYEYIMSLPGISDEVLQYLRETNAKNLAEFVGDALNGHVAGSAGNRALDAIVESLESWKGQKLEHTIDILMKTYDHANFSLVRTPAAWCVRFPSRVPHTAPCLPPAIQDAIRSGEITETVVPRFEHCVPWECGDAGHGRSDLATARRSHRYANKMAANSSKVARAHYQIQADYWEKVTTQLENGRSDVTRECLLTRWASEKKVGA